MTDWNDTADHSGCYTMKASDEEAEAARKRLIKMTKTIRIEDETDRRLRYLAEYFFPNRTHDEIIMILVEDYLGE
jgi:hypothetical protein